VDAFTQARTLLPHQLMAGSVVRDPLEIGPSIIPEMPLSPAAMRPAVFTRLPSRVEVQDGGSSVPEVRGTTTTQQRH
jgi:hypothetical protein